MAGNGPPPNPKRRRANRDTYADVQTRVVVGKPKLRGPTFNQVTAPWLDEEPDLKKLVERWWNTWRRSPLAEAFLETDWERLAMLVPLVASYYARPHYTKLAEIRQNESLLGATHVDRLKARIKVEQADDQPVAVPAGVAALDEYRARLA